MPESNRSQAFCFVPVRIPFHLSVYLWSEILLQYPSRFLSLLCVLSLLIGCSKDGPQVVPAGGVVTFKGNPVGKINVMLMPSGGGSGMIAEGTTDEAGKFQLQTLEPGDGAMVGDYIVGFKYVPDEVPEMPGFEGAKKVVSPIPEKYADATKSGFTAKVDSDKSKNNFTFNLE